MTKTLHVLESCRLLLPALMSCLGVRDDDATDSPDPTGPGALVVLPHDALAEALRARLAAEPAGALNLRLLTPLRLARQLAFVPLAERGQTTATALSSPALAAAVIEALAEDTSDVLDPTARDVFAGAVELPGLRDALNRTRAEFSLGEVTPKALKTLAGLRPLAAPRLLALAALLKCHTKLAAALGIAEPAEIWRSATNVLSQTPERLRALFGTRRLVFVLPLELPPVVRAFVRGLVQAAVETTLFVVEPPDAAGEATRAVRIWAAELAEHVVAHAVPAAAPEAFLLGAAGDARAQTPAEAEAPAAVATAEPPADRLTPLPEVRAVAAATPAGELREIVRAVVRGADAGIPYREMAVLVRGPEMLLPVAAALTAQGCPASYVGRGVLDGQPEARGVLGLLRVAYEGFDREALFRVLGLFEIAPQAYAGATTRRPREDAGAGSAAGAEAPALGFDVRRFDLLTREANVVSGVAELSQRLLGYAEDRLQEAARREVGRAHRATAAVVESPAAPAGKAGTKATPVRRAPARKLDRKPHAEPHAEPHALDPTGARAAYARLSPAARCRRDAEDAYEAHRRLTQLMSALEGVLACRDWASFAARYEAVLAELLSDEGGASHRRALALATVRRLADLALTGLPASPENALRTLEDLLSGGLLRRGRLLREGVTVAPITDAWGIQAQLVIVPGLVARRFPRHVNQDPVVLDEERQALREATGHGWPLDRRRLIEREWFYVEAALAAASHELVLTYPAHDPTLNRPITPSQALVAVAGKLAGAPVALAALTSEPFMTVRAGGQPASECQPPITPGEYDRQVVRAFSSWDRRRAYLAPEIAPRYAAGVQALAAAHHPELTPYDGFVGPRALAETGIDPLAMLWSPSRFETFARCPRRFFFRYVVRLEPVPEPGPVEELDPRTAGSIVHAALETVFRDGLSTSAQGRREQAARAFDAAAAPYAQRGDLGPRQEFELERYRLTELIVQVLEHDARESPYLPIGVEVTLRDLPHDSPLAPRIPDPGVLTVPLPDGAKVALHGVIDRLDAHDLEAAHPGFRVIDYKISRKRDPFVAGSLEGARQAQVGLYLLALDSAFGGLEPQHTWAGYYLLSRRDHTFSVVPVVAAGTWPAYRTELLRVVALVLHQVRRGVFEPEPGKVPEYGGLLPQPENCRYCDYQEVCGAGVLLRADRKKDAQLRQPYATLAGLTRPKNATLQHPRPRESGAPGAPASKGGSR